MDGLKSAAGIKKSAFAESEIFRTDILRDASFSTREGGFFNSRRGLQSVVLSTREGGFLNSGRGLQATFSAKHELSILAVRRNADKNSRKPSPNS